MIKRITKDGGHYFYGYYDLPFLSRDGRYHLCHKVSFIDRMPTENDVAIIGMIDLQNNNEFIPLSQTTAWNFQQGSFLQWHPTEENKIIYNVRTGNTYGAEILDVKTGEIKKLSMPVATVSPNGKYAISINFSRMFNFRPGYGYAGFKDENFDIKAPKNDGIFLIDLETGASKLVLPISDLKGFLKTKNSLVADGKILVNHINFNTDGSRFVSLVRTFATGENEWRTATVTGNFDGTDLYLLSDYKQASHYYWKNEAELLIWATHTDGTKLYLLKDKSEEFIAFNDDCFKPDGHCSYSKDKNFILYDSYPDPDECRHLFVYDVNTKEKIFADKFKTIIPCTLDIRCDLHPRFIGNTKNVSFDSTHEGFRGIYIVEM